MLNKDQTMLLNTYFWMGNVYDSGPYFKFCVLMDFLDLFKDIDAILVDPNPDQRSNHASKYLFLDGEHFLTLVQTLNFEF